MPTRPLRIVFMGTPDFAVPTLKALISSRHQVVAVYTQPPRPKGRGQQVQKSPVHLTAEALGLAVFTPVNFKEASDVEAFISHKADVAVVVAYGLILPLSVLSAPRLGCINSHASLLPRWRGAAPIQRAILTGDRETGISFMKMEEGLDTGPIIGMVTHPITADTTAAALHDRLARISGDHIVPVLEEFAAGNIIPQPQPSNGVTYAAKLKKEESKLDFHQSAKMLDQKIRALNPWPGTFFSYNNQPIKVLAATLSDKKGEPGTVLDDHLTIACGEGALQPTLLQKAGSKPMSTQDFLNGFALSKGSRLNAAL